MKKTIIIFFLLISCIGCKTKSDISKSTNNESISFKAFNDERYIWESWSFSTNKVQKIK